MRRDLSKARMSAYALGAASWYDSVEDLLRDDSVDAVYIATPPGLHLNQALACCRYKKPVYIEKPFARNFSEAHKLVDTFEKAGVSLFVAHYRRALPRFLELKAVIDSGEIGEITDTRIRLTRRYKDDRNHAWLFRPELSGGGKFFDIAPHSIDLLVFLFGDFNNVHSSVITTTHGSNLEDLVAFCFDTVNGVVGSANFNFISGTKDDQFEIFGRAGSISAYVHGNEPIVVNGLNGQRVLEIANPRYIEESMIGEVVKHLRGEESKPCFGRDALATYRIIDQILSKFYGGREDEFWARHE